MQKTNQTIDIVLPSRIGDCILTLPALLCLKQLNEKYKNKAFKVRIFSTNKLTEIIDAYNLFEVRQYTNSAKILSLFKPSDNVVFLETSTRNMGFFGKKTYGIKNDRKKVKYTVNIPYLNPTLVKDYLPENLCGFLSDKFNLSICSISYFGILLDIGFSPEEIMDTFDFSENALNFDKKISNTKSGIQNYIVLCMEAAYGAKQDADRRFKEEHYFEISKTIYEKFGLNSAFIGIDDRIKLPETNYIYDFRKKLSFPELAQLMKFSKAYIGNDTGPLHLANLMKTRSLGIYARENTIINYSPIFPHLNTVSLNIPTLEQVNDFCSELDL